jgi:hypothetical protein
MLFRTGSVHRAQVQSPECRPKGAVAEIVYRARRISGAMCLPRPSFARVLRRCLPLMDHNRFRGKGERHGFVNQAGGLLTTRRGRSKGL